MAQILSTIILLLVVNVEYVSLAVKNPSSGLYTDKSCSPSEVSKRNGTLTNSKVGKPLINRCDTRFWPSPFFLSVYRRMHFLILDRSVGLKKKKLKKKLWSKLEQGGPVPMHHCLGA